MRSVAKMASLVYERENCDPESKQIYTRTKVFLYVFVGLRTEQNF